MNFEKHLYKDIERTGCPNINVDLGQCLCCTVHTNYLGLSFIRYVCGVRLCTPNKLTDGGAIAVGQ